MTDTAAYGSWRSPIDPATVASGGRRLGGGVLAADGAVWWSEARPEEGGRVVLMRRPSGGEPEAVTPAGFNVRTRVHEYGGGAWTLLAPDLVVFANFEDQRLYRQALGTEPIAITPEPERAAALRYADLCPSADGSTLYCVRESHPEVGEPANEIVSLPALDDEPGEQTVIASGRDFYSFPRLDPDGERLAFTCWDHPNMPWDGTELWLTPLAAPDDAQRLAGGPTESIFQPAWDPEGRLHFASDRDGWWNLYRVGAADAIEQLTVEQADLGHPQWLFGGATYAFLGDGTIVCVRTDQGEELLGVLEPGAERVRDLGLAFTAFGFPSLSARGTRVGLAAATPARGTEVVTVDFAAGEPVVEVVRSAGEQEVPAGYVSQPRAIAYPTGEGDVAYGFFYPPTNPEFEAPVGELPPLVVQSHGGPTSHAVPAFDHEFAFWTSRGFGVVDVNYRGSSGYGRAFRDKLRGTWGIFDTEDCIAAAQYLAANGEADGERLTIRGGSAGGYATLCALVFHQDFAAGASYYGVADTETLARDTHKFEARYLDGLIGPYPEDAEVYRERSPINFVERLRSPVIIFQGLDDEIVPPNQAETMVAALAQNGIPHAYLAFAGEGHGFRRSETEIRCLEAELYFYGKILGFEPADDLEPIEIEGSAAT